MRRTSFACVVIASLILGSGTAAAQTSNPPGGLPLEMVRGLKASRSLWVTRVGDLFRFQLSGRAPASSEEVTLDLLRSKVRRPSPRNDLAERAAWAWTSGGTDAWYTGGGGDRDDALKLLISAGPEERWQLDFELPAEAAGGGHIAVLELGPYRPLYVRADPGIELLGVHGAPTKEGGYEGLLGASGGLGVLAPKLPENAPKLREALGSRLRPPGKLVVDGYYRASLTSLTARMMVRDLSPHPGPRLDLELIGDAKVLAVHQYPGNRKVLFRQQGDRLALHPGPGPGPRYYLIDLAGAGPQEYSRDFALPYLRATSGRTQSPGILALDAVEPGENGVFNATGSVVSTKKLEQRTWLKEAWGGARFLAFEATSEAPRLAISKPRNRQEKRTPDVEVATTLAPAQGAVPAWTEVTRLTFELDAGAVWIPLSITLPPGAKDPHAFQGDEPVALVFEQAERAATPEEVSQPVRFMLEAGQKVVVAYRREKLSEVGGGLTLELPAISSRIGSLLWKIEGPEGFLLGAPQDAAPAIPTTLVTTGGSAGATTPFGSSVVPVAVPLPPASAKGATATYERHDLSAVTVIEVTVAVCKDQEILLGHTLLFLAGLLAMGWFLAGRPGTPLGMAIPFGASLLLVAGVLTGRIAEVFSPWSQTVLGGALFAVLVRLLWWGLGEGTALMPTFDGGRGAATGPKSSATPQPVKARSPSSEPAAPGKKKTAEAPAAASPKAASSEDSEADSGETAAE